MAHHKDTGISGLALLISVALLGAAHGCGGHECGRLVGQPASVTAAAGLTSCANPPGWIVRGQGQELMSGSQHGVAGRADALYHLAYDLLSPALLPYESAWRITPSSSACHPAGVSGVTVQMYSYGEVNGVISAIERVLVDNKLGEQVVVEMQYQVCSDSIF